MLTLLLAPAALAQFCGGASYNTDPAAFAHLTTSDFQDVAPGPWSGGYTEASPYVFQDVAYWPDFWVTNGFCIPGMDTAGCGGTNNYLGNFYQMNFAPVTPSDAIGFRWGTQGPSVEISVWLSDGNAHVFPINGQSGYFAYCTGDATVSVTRVQIQSADGGIDEISWGTMDAPPPVVFEVAEPQLVSGTPGRIVAVNADPGETVLFAGSFTAGAGPCPAQLGGQCLGLVQPTFLGSAVADATGAATLQVNVPAGLAGRVAYLQAAVRRGAGGVDSELTPVRTFTLY